MLFYYILEGQIDRIQLGHAGEAIVRPSDLRLLLGQERQDRN
jgi:hypothetical protein